MKVNSYSLKHTVSPTPLIQNGVEYKLLITIYNENNRTQVSDPVIFQTSSTPIVTVDNLDTVNSFSYNFSATYSQAEDVPLRTYNVVLYDDKKNPIDRSNVKSILPMEHLFSNLQTERQYYIEFIATSAKGLTGTSGLVSFSVFFYRPKMNIDLQGKNIDNAGIELSWYIRQIIGSTYSAHFIDNEKIDTINHKKVWFDEGFDIEKDFSLKVWIEQPYMSNIVEQVNLISIRGVNGEITLQYHDDRKFHAWKTVNGLKSHWFSAEVQGESYVVTIQQVKDDLNIYAEVVS